MLGNDDGTDFLPARLIAVVVCATVLAAAAAAYAQQQAQDLSTGSARAGAARIAGAACAEYADSCPGAGDGATVAVTIPGSVRSVIFGGRPSNGTILRSDCIYCIELGDGSTEIYSANAPFARGYASGPRDEPLVLYPGKHLLRVRAEAMNGGFVAAITPEACDG